MAARIEASATALPRFGVLRTTALGLADAAADACLKRAARSAGDIEILVNVGIYRDDNLAEPALAALIQEDIGASPGHPPHPGRHGTFSFDVNAGGCGVVTALELLSGFIDSGTLETGLIVASDADPTSGHSSQFPFPAVGGALLVRPARPGSGFIAFHFGTPTDPEPSLEAAIIWHPEERRLLHASGKNLLTIERSVHFGARASDYLAGQVRAFVAEQGFSLADIDLVIPSQFPAELPGLLAQRLELPADRVVDVGDGLAGAHTAGPIAAWEKAERDGRLGRARLVLFATIGAGFSVGLAAYRRT